MSGRVKSPPGPPGKPRPDKRSDWLCLSPSLIGFRSWSRTTTYETAEASKTASATAPVATSVSLVLNVITPSPGERRIWVPVAVAMLASSLVVAIS